MVNLHISCHCCFAFAGTFVVAVICSVPFPIVATGLAAAAAAGYRLPFFQRNHRRRLFVRLVGLWSWWASRWRYLIVAVTRSCQIGFTECCFAFCYFRNSFIEDSDFATKFHTKYELKAAGILQLAGNCSNMQAEDSSAAPFPLVLESNALLESDAVAAALASSEAATPPFYFHRVKSTYYLCSTLLCRLVVLLLLSFSWAISMESNLSYCFNR